MEAPAKDAMEGRPPGNLFRTIAHAPTILPSFLSMGDVVLGGLMLDPKLRELCIIRVAALCETAYVLHHHRRLAATMDISDFEIGAAIQENTGEDLTEAARTALAFTSAVVRDVKAPGWLVDKLLELIGERQVTELLMVIGFYGMVTRVLRNAEVEIEPPDFRARPEPSE
jgi:alkylhydroperoxidase family enzyme